MTGNQGFLKRVVALNRWPSFARVNAFGFVSRTPPIAPTRHQGERGHEGERRC